MSAENTTASNSRVSSGERDGRYSSLPGGLDTVSFAYRWDDLDDWRIWLDKLDLHNRLVKPCRFSHRDPIRLTGNPNQHLKAQASLPGGIRFGFLPKSQGIWVEGRMAALLAGDKNNHDLLPAPFLRVAALAAAADISELLLDALDFPEALFSRASISLRRLDFAAEVSFSPSDGLDFLRALAECSLSGERPVSRIGRFGRTETVYLLERGGNIRMRVYDKGNEEKTAPPGTRIRFERVLRYSGKQSPVLESVTTDFLKSKWLQGLKPWFGEIGSVPFRVYPLDAAADAIIEQVEQGKLPVQSGETALAALLIRRRRGEQWWRDYASRSVGYRRAAQLRELGVLAAPVKKQIDIGEVLKIARASVEEPALFPALAPARVRKIRGSSKRVPWDADWTDEDEQLLKEEAA